ncbi:type VI secretion protein IcmF/TssM N-terminal domain-containing protein [Marinomonas sp. THO17]|uniref:type VI secretion protein IcmF/TssM N-terminal domain-containing protein n=1 Tax=Marinomonas sp. THO17 TaxID=3149048 RepID=UPI00336BFC8C
MKEWLAQLKSFMRQYDTITRQLESLYHGLIKRLEPLIEALKPIWQDPLWQMIALLIGLVLLVLVGAWFAKKMLALMRKMGKGVYRVLAGCVRLMMAPFSWVYKRLFRKKTTPSKPRPYKQRLLLVQIRRAIAVLEYLTTRQAWRYRMSWSLLLSDQAADKRQLMTGVFSGRRDRLLPREKRLMGGGGGWHFYDHGVVIEGDEATLAALVSRLHWYRPERPVDNLIVCISATSLLQEEEAALDAVGEALFHQLWQVQKQTGFVLPVYLMVTDCEHISGWQAYWDSQPEEVFEQMLGWSNPYRLDTAFRLDWINQAFAYVLQRLQDIKLKVAATGQALADMDGFMMFPHQFGKLQKPLSKVIKGAFSQSGFQEALPLRGLYFSGQRQTKVVFADAVFQHKIFAEKHLARVIDKRLFSSNTLFRRLQFSVLGLALGLAILLAHDIVRIQQFNQFGLEKLQQIHLLMPDCSELGGESYALLQGLSDISGANVSLAMPLSWFGHAAQRKEQSVSHQLLKNKLFQGLECRLEEKAEALLRRIKAVPQTDHYPTLLSGYFDRFEALLAFEENQQRLLMLAGPLDSDKGVSKALYDLLNYLYDNPVPETIDLHSHLIVGGVTHLNLPLEWSATDPLVDRQVVLNHLQQQTDQLLQALKAVVENVPIGPLQDFNRGPKRVPRHANLPASSIAQDLGRLEYWLQKTEQDWLSTTPQSSACGLIQSHLEEAEERMVLFGYNEAVLQAMAEDFAAQECDEPIRQELANLSVSPFGDLFVRNQAGVIEQSPALIKLMDKARAITQLAYIKGRFPPLLESSEIIVRWQQAPLQQLLDMLVQEQAFAAQYSATSLFENTLRSRLQDVTERLLSDAMIRPSQQLTAPPPSYNLIADRERKLQQAVSSFRQVSSLLLQIETLLKQQGDSVNVLHLNQKVNAFVHYQLAQIEQLVADYRLYQPVLSPDWQAPSFAQALFQLKDAKQTESYLQNQQQKINYLAFHYAQPLLQYLQNSHSGLSDLSVQRWLATLDDLARFERGEAGNPVSTLNDLIGQTLPALNNQACDDTLGLITLNQGNSWFAMRDRQITQQAKLECTSAEKKAIIQRYQTLARAFNQQLAGRFPFAELSQIGVKEVSPQQLQSFLAQYRTLSNHLLSDLDALMEDQDPAFPLNLQGSWRDFLLEMEQVNQFFEHIWQDKAKTWQANLNILFDAHAGGSSGSNQIISWQLQSGTQQLQFPNGETQFTWQVGQPLTLTLRWASGSAYRPLGPPSRSAQLPPVVDAALASARFDSQGQWALLEWIARYQNKLIHSQDGAALLSFYVPVVLKSDSQQAPVPAYVSRANVQLAAYVLDDKGQTRNLPLPLYFPTYAPNLSE